ncbi:MAG: DevR family CRISPR-associated autoregulator [Chloroflexi bacterium]|nr:DevR family CRISPR-associated autoregulator [Chloroflexota bacterium]
MTSSLYSISISARTTLDMHSLNNEGGEGNQIQTRMVNVIDQEGRLQNVNAISGDMFKHIQAEHLFRLLRERDDMPLCVGCQSLNANRINADAAFLAETAGLNDAELVDALLVHCAQDDIEGILITENKRSVPRKSVIEFGWVVGVPGSVETDSYFHVKYATERSSEQRAADRAGQESGANLGQAIFHRPASSGIYAAVCHLELARIGFNDNTQRYAIDEDERHRRMQVLLQSVLFTFMQPNGAMRSAQAPHLVDLNGVLTLSTGPVPAPTVSPLKDDFRRQIGDLRAELNQLVPDTVFAFEFDSLSGFAQVINELLQDTVPYALRYG